jgi:hypothetical protein
LSPQAEGAASISDSPGSYLHDDFRAVRLDAQLIAAPPVDLWPEVRARVPVPADVESVLLTPLRAPPAAKSSAEAPA